MHSKNARDIDPSNGVRQHKMMTQSSREINIGFKSVQIFKEQILGHGSYGTVYKARCDDLLCAAKILHSERVCDAPIFIRMFQQEYEILSSLRHPNIVQSLPMDMYRDPQSGEPAILMELMDEDLTHYLGLEQSTRPVPYHLQVNICYDVASAISFLHANDIIHRDICSNNILLVANAQIAKLCDFFSSVFKSDSDDNIIDLMKCPGIPAYMPHEDFTSRPVYTAKIDCFSFGVLVIQVLTRLFPQPGEPTTVFPRGKYAHAIVYHIKRVPEVERRQNHIHMIDPGHPLLPIALDCLKDREMDCPTAHQLCERIRALKESPQYTKSKRSSAAPDSEAGVREQLQRERQRQEQSQEEIHQLRDEVRQKEMLVEEVFENAKQQQTLAVEREVQNERRRIAQLEQQLAQNQTEMRRVQEQQRQKRLQKEHELTQSRQQMIDLQQQIRVEQQRALQAREQLSRTENQLQERIRELEQRLDQSEVEALGSRVTGLQLLPQGDSWNVPRREVRIVEQIGCGAAGLVSKGRYQGQEVAVKQIHREILREKHIMDEFKREVGIMATTQHPNLVRFIAAVFDERVDQLRETPLLVLELLRTNLRDAYKDFDLGPSKSVPIFRDVAYGLHYLHEHSEPIIHRDVSAPNIPLEPLPGDMWRAKLSDFGSANFLQRAKTLGVGAIVYTAPEMFPIASPSAPMPRPTTKCDVFSYGIVVVEVITKTMPTTENRHELFGEVERKWRFMHDLVSRCTEVSPHVRPTMADILNTLNRIPMARPR
jgi:serine/threonine protein kinase